METALPAPLLAGGVTFVVTPLCRSLALKLGMVDQPGGRKQHGEPVPMLGGLAVFAGLLVVWYSAYGVPTNLPHILLFLSVPGALVVGAWDDIRSLRTHTKVGWQVACVAVAVASIALSLPAVTATHWAQLLLCGAFLVGAMNLINFADTYDGLCVLTCAGLAAVMGVLTEGVQNTAVHWAMVGACLGFLPWNLSRRHRTFLGDGGSLMLGLLIGYLALETVWELRGSPDPEGGPLWPLPLLLLGVPILDGAVVTLHRHMAGRPVTVGARDHLSHRLDAAGLPPRLMVLVLAVATTAFAATALLYTAAPAGEGWLVLAGALTLWTGGLVVALRSPIYSGRS